LCKNGLFLVQVNILKPGGSLEKKSSSEDRKAINMENLELTQDFRSLQPWAQFGGGHGGRVLPTFSGGGKICHVPPTFSLQILYLEKFQK